MKKLCIGYFQTITGNIPESRLASKRLMKGIAYAPTIAVLDFHATFKAKGSMVDNLAEIFSRFVSVLKEPDFPDDLRDTTSDVAGAYWGFMNTWWLIDRFCYILCGDK